MFSDIKTRSYGLWEIFGLGTKTYLKILPIIIPLILIVYVPFIFLEYSAFKLLGYSALKPFEITPWIKGHGFLAVLEGLPVILALGFPWLLVWVFVAIVIAKCVELYVHGQEIVLEEILSYSLARWWRAMIAEFLVGLMVIGGILLLIVPGIIFMVYFMFISMVVALREEKVGAALKYSKNLVKGQWWQLFSIWIVIDYTSYAISMTIPSLAVLLPDLMIIQIFFDTAVIIVDILLYVMMVIFFLNTDYVRRQPASEIAPEPEGVKPGVVNRRNDSGLIILGRIVVGFVIIIEFNALMPIFTGLGSNRYASEVSAWVGKASPEFTITDLAGNQLSLSEMQGKKVVLNFWATRPSCSKEMPHFVKLRDEISADELIIAGISYEGIRTLENYIEENDINYPIVYANDLPDPYVDIIYIPTTFIIDRNGIIKNVLVGYQDYETLKAAVLEGDFVETPQDDPQLE